MGRLVLIVALFLSANLHANVYENNCIKCHKKLSVDIDKYFFRYLLNFSSEKNVKKAMFEYLKSPNKETTIMPQAFIKRFGIKKKTTLSDEDLVKALDIYWEKYKVFGKLK